MSDFIEWVPKHHGHKPLHWTPDMLTSVDGKNFVRQTNWAWIAGSTYYVPHEAVGLVREDVVEEADPLAEVWKSMFPNGDCGNCVDAEMLRAALDARGLEIREKKP
jgi:hypothetical protein